MRVLSTRGITDQFKITRSIRINHHGALDLSKSNEQGRCSESCVESQLSVLEESTGSRKSVISMAYSQLEKTRRDTQRIYSLVGYRY